MSAVSIRLGKKDNTLKAWWREAAKVENYDRAQSIRYALNHYISTGEHLCIARIKAPQIEYADVDSVKIYMEANSELAKWLLENEKKGVKKTKLIKEIILGSIEITEGQPQYYTTTELFNRAEILETKRHVTKIKTENEYSIVPESKIEEDNKEITPKEHPKNVSGEMNLELKDAMGEALITPQAKDAIIPNRDPSIKPESIDDEDDIDYESVFGI